MRRLLVCSAAVLLGCAGLAMIGHAQTANVPPPSVIRTAQGTIIVRGPFYPVSSPMGDLRLIVPGPLQSDSVYVDGSFVGVASQITDMQMAPGAHDVLICAPDGTPVYRQRVSVALNQLTEVQPFAAPNSGVAVAPSTAWAPVAPENVAPAEQGDLRLTTAYALRNDAVFVDGNYIGTARLSHDLELTLGTHEIALLAPNGDTDMVTSVGITANQVTRLRADHNQPSIDVNG